MRKRLTDACIIHEHIELAIGDTGDLFAQRFDILILRHIGSEGVDTAFSQVRA